MIHPQPVTPASIDVARAERHLLPNGAALYLLPADEFEVLRVSFVFRAGSAVQQAPFSASTTANLLSEGTRSMTARRIAEQLDFYGSWYDVNLDRDYAYINFAMLSKFAVETLRIAAEILLHPTFPEEELRTYCAKRRQRLEIDRTKVDVEAREAFAAALFGARHPSSSAAAASAQRSAPPSRRWPEPCPAARRAPPRSFRRSRPRTTCGSHTRGPCSRRCASVACSSRASTPTSWACRSWQRRWAATSVRA